MNGNNIQIFRTWTFECIGTLKGHNGRIRHLHWNVDDASLVSAGSDGAIYIWSLETMKRDSENVLKSCSYTSAVFMNASVYAIGSDAILRVCFFKLI